MKKFLFKFSAVPMLAFASMLISPPCMAQNLNEHYLNVSNAGIDYTPATAGYILSGNTFPVTVNGWSNVTTSILERIQLQKIDNNLNTNWFMTYVTNDEQTAILTHQCTHLAAYFYCGYAKHTANGGYIICGEVRRDGESGGGCNGPTYDNVFLLRTDASGNVIWYKRYNVTGMLNSVTETANGNFIACGYIGAGRTPSSSLIIGTDASGNINWSKTTNTPAPWGPPSNTISSYYQQVVPFQGRYALVGNASNGMYSSMLVSVVDDYGTFYQNALVNTYRYNNNQNTLFGNGLVDCGDGDLAITGISGQPCPGVPGFTDFQIMATKLEPYSMTIKFLDFYATNNSSSQGNGITVQNGNTLCFTGLDWANNKGIYAQTNFSGTISRYVELASSDAEVGYSMTLNTGLNIPVFAGGYSTDSNGFVITDNQNRDCTPDMSTSSSSPGYLIEYPTVTNPGVMQINDQVFAYPLTWNQTYDCGTSQPPVTRGQNIAGVNTNGTDKFEIAPNPADNQINVTVNDDKYLGGTLSIYDVTGRVMINEQVAEGANTLPVNISLLVPGSYVLRINNKDGSSYDTHFQKN